MIGGHAQAGEGGLRFLLPDLPHPDVVRGSGEDPPELLHGGEQIAIAIGGDDHPDFDPLAHGGQDRPAGAQRLIVAVRGDDQQTVGRCQAEGLEIGEGRAEPRRLQWDG